MVDDKRQDRNRDTSCRTSGQHFSVLLQFAVFIPFSSPFDLGGRLPPGVYGSRYV
jgi:hypothetical protein